MRKENPISLSKERKAAMIAEIKQYFAKEQNEELGDLAAETVLDFIIEKAGLGILQPGRGQLRTGT